MRHKSTPVLASLHRTTITPNAFRIDGSDAFLVLTQQNGPMIETVIDAADLGMVLIAGRWHVQTTPDDGLYVASWIEGVPVLLHRYLIGAVDVNTVDHIDGDGLNNRRRNIREATHTQNMQNRHMGKNNTSGFVGVSWNKSQSKWRGDIRLGGGRSKYLGSFDDPEEAARVYDDMVRLTRGEFARFNFPREGERGVQR